MRDVLSLLFGNISSKLVIAVNGLTESKFSSLLSSLPFTREADAETLNPLFLSVK